MTSEKHTRESYPTNSTWMTMNTIPYNGYVRRILWLFVRSFLSHTWLLNNSGQNCQKRYISSVKATINKDCSYHDVIKNTTERVSGLDFLIRLIVLYTTVHFKKVCQRLFGDNVFTTCFFYLKLSWCVSTFFIYSGTEFQLDPTKNEKFPNRPPL